MLKLKAYRITKNGEGGVRSTTRQGNNGNSQGMQNILPASRSPWKLILCYTRATNSETLDL